MCLDIKLYASQMMFMHQVMKEPQGTQALCCATEYLTLTKYIS